jgi:hypothetical protein
MTPATWPLAARTKRASSRSDQIECGDGDVWNHLPVERQREFDPVATDHRRRGLVDAVGVAF